MQIPAYNALMKIYRQEKAYKKELAMINEGIKVYEKYYHNHSIFLAGVKAFQVIVLDDEGLAR